MDDEQARLEVLRRFGAWGEQSVPARKYALLVAGYFRSRGPFLVEGEEKYLRFFNGDDGRALLELVEASADRPLSAAERAEATSRATAADEASWLRQSRYAVSVSDPDTSYLRHVLDNPLEAVGQLLTEANRSFSRMKFSWLDFLRVMECLWPAAWGPAAAWTPPTEAVRWARQIYERRDFTDLPILADLLEDAECPDRHLLQHCRSYPEHFRGCAAIDRLLGL